MEATAAREAEKAEPVVRPPWSRVLLPVLGVALVSVLVWRLAFDGEPARALHEVGESAGTVAATNAKPAAANVSSSESAVPALPPAEPVDTARIVNESGSRGMTPRTGTGLHLADALSSPKESPAVPRPSANATGRTAPQTAMRGAAPAAVVTAAAPDGVVPARRDPDLKLLEALVEHDQPPPHHKAKPVADQPHGNTALAHRLAACRSRPTSTERAQCRSDLCSGPAIRDPSCTASLK